MSETICPIDGLPCDPACPDRYTDQPEGGCILTTAIERGHNVMILESEGSK